MNFGNKTKKIPESALLSAEEKVQLLSGKCPRLLTKKRLREWLSYRKGTSKDGSARADATKAELAQRYRVVSYIKNGWEEDFVDKWQHMPSSQPKQTITNATGTPSEFPGSAEWLPLRHAKDSVPAFDMQRVISYFIERKTKDNEANKDYKNVSSKAFGLFRHGHIQKIEFARDSDKVHIRCNCLLEMKKTITYKLELSLVKNGDREGEIVYASCGCPAGRGPLGSCKHIAGACYALEEFSRLKCTREYETCTSKLQTWNQPRKRKLDPQSVYDIEFSRKIYGREESNASKPLTDSRRQCDRNDDSQSVNKELLEKIKTVKPNCGFFCLLSDKKLHQKEIISPIKEQPVSLKEISDRAARVRNNLMVSEQERKKIAKLTKTQSNCQEWYAHRRVRITASKCKRAIVQPSTSPTKAMEEILHYKNQYQSAKMKRILSLYEKKLNCKVNDTGFLISHSHPFLGASPDGEVDGGLVEIKRIFSNGLTVNEAVCKRYICKRTCHGLVVNKNHKFHYQVQLQMFCSEYNWTDQVLSDLNDMIIIHIKKCNAFLSSIIPKPERFYNDHISFELAYPRVAYGLPRLSKLINITD